MRKWFIFLVALCTVGYTQDQVPQIINDSFSGPEGNPVWVSQGTAAAKEGGLNLSMFSQNARYMVSQSTKKMKARPLDGSHSDSPCMTVKIGSGNHIPNKTYQDLLVHGKAVIYGTIVAVHPGFYEGFPASLLQIEVNDTARYPIGKDTSKYVYTYYPQANFDLAGVTYCATGKVRKAKPLLGNKVVMVPYYPHSGVEVEFYFLDDGMFFMNDAQGELVIPWRFSEDPKFSQVFSVEQLYAVLSRDIAPRESLKKEDQ